jgi:amino acid transporter
MLKRDIKRWSLVLIMVNTIIGAGIFGLPSRIFSISGIYSIPIIFLCALLIFVFIMIFAEVGSQFKKTGGSYLYTLKAFGEFPAFIIGWINLVGRIVSFAALINLLLDYLSFVNESFTEQSTRTVSILIITIFLFITNYSGVKNSSRLINILSISKIIPLLFFVITGFFFIDINLIDFSKSAIPTISDLSSTIFILIFAFMGFGIALVNTGEISTPKKDIPFAMITASLFIAIFYSLIQIVAVGTFPDLINSNKPIADAANSFLGPVGGLIITIGAIISIGGTLNGNVLIGSRVPFALSEKNQFPKIFSKTHPKTAVPHISLWLYLIIAILVSISGTFIYLLSISVICSILVYFTVSASLIKLRMQNKNIGYKLRYGNTIAILGMLICIWLLSVADLSKLVDVFMTIGAGIIIYFIANKKK